MLITFILIIVISIIIGGLIARSLDDKKLIVPITLLVFVLGFNITIFLCCTIPDLKSQAIKDYTSGKYRKEITYKMVQKDSLMVPVDSTIIYKPIKVASNEK